MNRPSDEIIMQALKNNHWQRNKTAEQFGVIDRTLGYWLRDMIDRGFVIKKSTARYKKPPCPLECRCFPSNEYRLEALDRPKGPGAPKYNMWDGVSDD